MTRPDYVEVLDEPRHRRCFENDLVRVYDVLIPPGDVSLFHRHTEDTYYISIVDAYDIREQVFGEVETSTIPQIPAGFGVCRKHRSQPLIHQVSNGGQTDMRMIGAELKRSPPTSAAKALDHPNHVLLSEEARYRSYSFQLEPGQTTGILKYNFFSLTVVLNRTNLKIDYGETGSQTITCAPGHTIWSDPLTFSVTNVGEDLFSSIVLEWTQGT